LLTLLAQEVLTSGTQSLTGLIRAQLVRLEPRDRDVLIYLAVAGGVASERLLLETLGQAPSSTALRTLHASGFILPRSLSLDAPVQVSHEQLAAAVRDQLDHERRCTCHCALAGAMERIGQGTAAQRAIHWHAGERPELAAVQARQAAEQAEACLAFRDSAQWWSRYLEWGSLEDVDRVDPLQRQASALTLAGCVRAAAPVFGEAAKLAKGSEAFELDRRATQSLLETGAFEEGLAALERLSSGLRVRVAGSPSIAMLRVMLGLLRLRLLGIEFDGDHPSDAATALCWTGVRGLLAVDTFRGADLLFQGLFRASAVGDRTALVRFAALLTGAMLAPMGNWGARWARSLLDRLQPIAAGSRYLECLVEVGAAHVDLQCGRWASASERSLAACDAFHEHCPGTSWERSIAAMVYSRSLLEQGRLDELDTRSEADLADARDRDDPFAETMAMLSLAESCCVRGSTGQARLYADQAEARWPSVRGIAVQHVYAQRARCLADIVDGRLDEARVRLDSTIALASRAGFLVSPVIQIDLKGLWARLAVDQRRKALAVERRLRRLGRQDGIALAHAIRAAWSPISARQACWNECAVAFAEAGSPRWSEAARQFAVGERPDDPSMRILGPLLI
jgi:hypothetical protein